MPKIVKKVLGNRLKFATLLMITSYKMIQGKESCSNRLLWKSIVTISIYWS